MSAGTRRFGAALLALGLAGGPPGLWGAGQETPVPSRVKPPSELKIESPVKGWGQRFVDWGVGLITGQGENHIRVYFPALSTDPNSGATLGFMPIALLQDRTKTIRHILAPSLTFNRIFGTTPTMRYYYYPRPETQFFFIGQRSSTTNERLTLRYTDPRLASWIYLKAEATHQVDGSNRFFGFGADSPQSAESTYSLNQLKAFVTFGVHLPLKLQALWTTTYRKVRIEDGPLPNLPQMLAAFPETVPAARTSTSSQKLAIARDSRDSTVTPVRGGYYELYGEAARRSLGSDAEFTRYGFEGRAFLPKREDRWVSAIRFQYGFQTGTPPFFERFWLGGSNQLRGFGDGRFVDRGIALFNFEERIRMYRMKAFGVDTDFELTPFFDVGSVFGEPSHWRLRDLHPVAGVGVRAVVKPTVVGFVDIGFGELGTATFVGIDYPF